MALSITFLVSLIIGVLSEPRSKLDLAFLVIVSINLLSAGYKFVLDIDGLELAMSFTEFSIISISIISF